MGTAGENRGLADHREEQSDIAVEREDTTGSERVTEAAGNEVCSQQPRRDPHQKPLPAA